MKSLRCAALFGLTFLFINGVYAQNLSARVDNYGVQGQAHPRDAQRYELYHSPMKRWYRSAPTVKPGGRW